MTRDTIYALSSGAPPAAIAVVRISGPAADRALQALAGRLPEPRRATLAALRDSGGDILDNALLLRFRGPGSATGEDLVELHLHGGRSVVAAVLGALAALDGLRPALAGEFTRRAFENGRIDLAEAEGLADLLTAETESQRRAALLLAGGALSRRVEAWQRDILALSASVEAALDFAGEDDVGEGAPAGWRDALAALVGELAEALSAAPVERLKDGLKVVIAGPPNAGKSSLFNVIVGRDAAIISATAGTTRDIIEAPLAIRGIPFLFLDTAGLRDTGDEVESIGIDRARSRIEGADIIFWLGSRAEAPNHPDTVIVRSKADLAPLDSVADISVSAHTGAGIEELVQLLLERASHLLPSEGQLAVNARHRTALTAARTYLEEAIQVDDLLIVAEALRQARLALDRVTGRAGVEDMLDALFNAFCIGK